MTSKERVEKAFLFKTPDQTPYFRWDNPEQSDIVRCLDKSGRSPFERNKKMDRSMGL